MCDIENQKISEELIGEIINIVEENNCVNSSDESKDGSSDLSSELLQKNREALRKRFEAQKEQKKNRSIKVAKDQNKAKILKDFPILQNLNNLPEDIDIKNLINNMASKMTNDPKQKKMMKKKINKLVDELKETKI
jgi:hypothetical protein